MSRYIEREAVMKTARDGYHSDFGKSMADLTSLREVLEDTPTADVVEVVRCRECKHFDKNKGYRDTKFSFSFCNKFHHNITTENDFCSYGERR